MREDPLRFETAEDLTLPIVNLKLSLNYNTCLNYIMFQITYILCS